MQACLELVNKLKQLRVQNIYLLNQIKTLDQRRRLSSLNLKRIETQKILEVEKSRQTNGQPLTHDVHVKQAMVEDMLAQDKPAVALMHKMTLLDKHIQRKWKRWHIIEADLKALESEEQILILQAT